MRNKKPVALTMEKPFVNDDALRRYLALAQKIHSTGSCHNSFLDTFQGRLAMMNLAKGLPKQKKTQKNRHLAF